MSKVFDEVFQHEGVTFCLGPAFVDHVLAADTAVDQATIDQAYDQLDDYVTRRDVGEARELGTPARPMLAHVQDLLIAAFLAAVTIVAIVSAIKLPPTGAWAIALAGAIATASQAVRHRSPGNERVQRATVATGTASLGLGALLTVLVVIDLIW